MDLHDLLESKAFEELDGKERAFVLNQMSQETYETERGAILASQAFFMKEEQMITPNPIAPNKALLALKERREKIPFWTMLLSYKIPAWQAVAAAILFFFLMNGLEGAKTADEPQLLANNNLRDTVFVNKYITASQTPDTVVKVIYKTQTNKSKKRTKKSKQMASNVVSTNRQPSQAKARVVSREFDDVLQYCNTSVSAPASKDTFLQLLSNEVLF